MARRSLCVGAMTSRYLFTLVLASASLTACAVDETEDSLSELSSNLSGSNWAGPVWRLENLSTVPAMTVLHTNVGSRAIDQEYYVFPYDDGDNPLPNLSHDLYYQRCSTTDRTSCTDPIRIPDQESQGPASVVAFNGKIYMVHQGDSDASAVWFSHFDPSTGVWSPNIKLDLTTYGGPPALAVFNNTLYIAGLTTNGSWHPLWWATLDTNGNYFDYNWVAGTNLSETSAVPSLATFNNKLYLANITDSDAGYQIQIRTLTSPSTGFSGPSPVDAGPRGSYLTGSDVKLAVANGYLHLVHRAVSSDDNARYWTYASCLHLQWATQVAIPNFSYDTQTTLAAGIGGTVVTDGLSDTGLWPYTHFNWYQSRLTTVAAPTCTINPNP
jgi:hypothetical protein